MIEHSFESEQVIGETFLDCIVRKYIILNISHISDKLIIVEDSTICHAYRRSDHILDEITQLCGLHLTS